MYNLLWFLSSYLLFLSLQVTQASGDLDLKRGKNRLSHLANTSVNEALALTSRSRIRAKEIIQVKASSHLLFFILHFFFSPVLYQLHHFCSFTCQFFFCFICIITPFNCLSYTCHSGCGKYISWRYSIITGIFKNPADWVRSSAISIKGWREIRRAWWIYDWIREEEQ